MKEIYCNTKVTTKKIFW